MFLLVSLIVIGQIFAWSTENKIPIKLRKLKAVFLQKLCFKNKRITTRFTNNIDHFSFLFYQILCVIIFHEISGNFLMLRILLSADVEIGDDQEKNNLFKWKSSWYRFLSPADAYIAVSNGPRNSSRVCWSLYTPPSVSRSVDDSTLAVVHPGCLTHFCRR